MEFKKRQKSVKVTIPKPTVVQPIQTEPPRHFSLKNTSKSILFRARQIGRLRLSILSIVGALLLAGLFYHFVYASNFNKNKNTEPAFRPVLPVSRTISDLGGWQRVSPPENDPVFAYSDKIGAVSISVSQQPLPESFKHNVGGKVAELAEKFNATTEIEGENTKIYLGTSAKGPQSVIFTKNGLLVLIKSQEKIDQKTWAKYVNTLDNPEANNLPRY